MEILIDNKISLQESSKIVTDIFESSFKIGDPTFLHYMKNPLKKFLFKDLLGTFFYRYQLKVFKVYGDNEIIAYLFTQKISDELAICIDIYIPKSARGKGLSKLVLELYRKELYKEGYKFCMGASFYKNNISYQMTKKHCQADFFYEMGFSYNRKAVPAYNRDIHFQRVKKEEIKKAYLAINSTLIKDFTTVPVTNTISEAAISFIWGDKIYAITVNNEIVGYICYQSLDDKLYLKLDLKNPYWEHAPEITNSFCDYNSLIPHQVIVQYPTNIDIERNDIQKVKPTLLFSMFETLGGGQ